MKPVDSIHKCPDCKGTGADAKKTAIHRKKEGDKHSYIRCWTCNGNGLDPSAFFRTTGGKQ
jgi:DnaJ-class molecular chaperone